MYSSSVNCSIQFPFAIILTALDGTAGMYVVDVWYYTMKLCMISFSVVPMENTPVTLDFEKCNMTWCHCIPIVNDDVPESNEMFYVTLEGTADLDRDKIRLDPANGTIEIRNDENL